MNRLVLQLIYRQWDKGQRSEQDEQWRAALADRYTVKIPPARTLDAGNIIIDQHGEDRLGNRLQYHQDSNPLFIIDRFHIDRARNELAYDNDTALIPLGPLSAPWNQYRYQWRYRVEESGMIYWLYEMVILNIAVREDFDPDLFVRTEPARIHAPLTTPSSSSPLKLAARY
ncbi:MAG: hypothetical protein RI563_07655 [Thiohalophilus sp.]|uniref:hypothetical protein n=1 Tax=Thiohalophilus sp. TaxID=3028392 RepID=UPI0028703A3C|nr:hypothetical protein [Thiohalophilus sp.]MDR9436740.1 hypothetical protein [Thiohalophilus sp.]